MAGCLTFLDSDHLALYLIAGAELHNRHPPSGDAALDATPLSMIAAIYTVGYILMRPHRLAPIICCLDLFLTLVPHTVFAADLVIFAAAILVAVRSKTMGRDVALQRYTLSSNELSILERAYDDEGVVGLRDRCLKAPRLG